MTDPSVTGNRTMRTIEVSTMFTGATPKSSAVRTINARHASKANGRTADSIPTDSIVGGD
jgi:hypothetical protein